MTDNLSQVYSVRMKLIQETEYISLITENNDMRTRLAMLDSTNKLLENQNKHHVNEIDELKRENLELQKTIMNLQNTIIDLKKDITEFKQQRYDDKLMDKLVYGIQDMNSIQNLEMRLDLKNKKQLKYLRNSRNGNAHYIYKDDDSAACKTYKQQQLLLKLSELPNNLKEKISIKYGDTLLSALLTEMRQLLPSTRPEELTADEMDDTRNWWIID